MTEKDIEQIKKIYGNSSIQKENIVHEYVRMVVQQRVFGKTTEYETFTLSNELMLFFEKLLERLNDFLSTIIGSTNTQKAIEDVINFTKGNFSKELDDKIINRVFNKGQILETNLNVLNNFQEEQKELDEIVEDINNTNQDIKYQLSKEQSEGIIASEKTIRDLAARMSDRIGIPFRIISDRTQQFKGKIENNVAYVNLAYATLDTPIHEILGHPIIRALKIKSEKTIESEIDKMIEMGIIKKEC